MAYEKNERDKRIVPAIMIGLIGIVTFWTILIPLFCVMAIVELYEK
jgi:hypothetical protein